MKMQLFIHALASLLLLGLSQASVIPVTPTYATATHGFVAAASNQAIARNYNRLYVPGFVPTVTTAAALPLPVAAYPSYSYAATTTYHPHAHTLYRYGSYPYGAYYPSYGYGYSLAGVPC